MDREKTKPVEITFEEEILGVSRVTGLCPVCKKDIDPYNHPNYCGHCGQSIRWVGQAKGN